MTMKTKVEKKDFLIHFKGKDLELHRQLRQWCFDNNVSIHKTILMLIAKHNQKQAK